MLILTLGISSCSTDQATVNEAADEVEESVNEEYEILSNGVAAPLVPENSSHGYLTEDDRIPILNSCIEWYEFWKVGEGLAVSFDIAEKYTQNRIAVSTEIYKKNLYLDSNKDGIICLNEDSNSNQYSAEVDFEDVPSGVEIPPTPENSNHGYLLEDDRIPRLFNCDEWDGFWVGLGPAISFKVVETIGDPRIAVSTQIYLKNKHLDENQDGVICYSEDKEVSGPDDYDSNLVVKENTENKESITDQKTNKSTTNSSNRKYVKVVNDIRSYIPTSKKKASLIGFKSKGVPNNVYQHFLDVTTEAHAFWSQFSERSRRVQTMMIFSNSARDAYINRLSELNIDSKYENVWGIGSSGGGGTAIPDKNGNVHIVYRLTVNTELPMSDYMYHETTHAYQNAYGGMDNWKYEPCWFGEGYAMVVGLAHSFKNSSEATKFYEIERKQRLKYTNQFLNNYGNDWKTGLTEALVYSHAGPMCNSQEPFLGYRLGMIISEAWIHEFGFKRTVKFLEKIENNDFEGSFEKEFGISMNDWLLTKGYEYVVDALGRS